jgi:hypothetical protein
MACLADGEEPWLSKHRFIVRGRDSDVAQYKLAQKSKSCASLSITLSS